MDSFLLFPNFENRTDASDNSSVVPTSPAMNEIAPNQLIRMKPLRRPPALALAIASIATAIALHAADFVIDDGTSETAQASENKIVLLNQTGQPQLKVFASANPKEKPQPQTELKEADYTVSLSDPTMEVSLYVSTMDNKKKSAIRRAKNGDVLAVVFQDGGLAILKHRTSKK